MKGKLLVAISVLLFIMPLAFAEDSDFVLVEGGSFLMGSRDGSAIEMPVHLVTLSSFAICTHEVTQAEDEAVMGKNPSCFKGARLPVERVSWYDAVYFCNKLSVMHGLTPVYAVDSESDVSKWGYEPNSSMNMTDENRKFNGTVTQNIAADGYRLPSYNQKLWIG